MADSDLVREKNTAGCLTDKPDEQSESQRLDLLPYHSSRVNMYRGSCPLSSSSSLLLPPIFLFIVSSKNGEGAWRVSMDLGEVGAYPPNPL